MANLAASVGGMLGAGVRGIMDMADGLMHIGEADPLELLQDDKSGQPGSEHGDLVGQGGKEEKEEEATPVTARPQPRRMHSHSDTAIQSSSLSIPSTNASAMSTSISNLSLRQSALIQTMDVPSGWIHLQNTYIDVAGSDRTVRSFGVRNLVDEEVEVEVASDLGEQVVFWRGEDEKVLSSAASYSSASSASTSTGTTSLILPIPPQSSVTVSLAFIPSRHTSASPPIPQSPMLSDGGFTPRVLPTQRSTAVSAMPLDSFPAASGPSVTSGLGGGGDIDSVSAGSSQSVAGSLKAPSSIGAGGRRTEPNYRAFSLHGCITLRASVATASTPRTDSSASALNAIANGAMQMLNLPFFATVCKSHFTAALLDPSTGLASNSHQGSGQMVIDFGSECVMGQEYHRDILLVNRSEIELVWMTAVVNSRYKDQAWFSLRDLDSENVFGVDTSSQPVPLPSLSSRHLRLTLRIREPVIDFAFDFVISNVNQSGNLVTCRAIGSGQSSSADNVLKLLSGTNLDFGQVVDGMWSKTLITCKNAGDKPMDVRFSASQGQEVCFRLAGVAGDDMDEDILLDSRIKRIPGVPGQTAVTGSNIPGVGQGVHDNHALLAAPPRSSARSAERERGRMTSSPLRSRPTSPSGSSRFGASVYGSESHGAYNGHRYETDSQVPSYAFSGTHTTGPSLRDPSLPPSRPLSRVASRSSSYRYAHTDATESDEDESEAPFLGGAEAVPPPSQSGASASGFSSGYAPSIGTSVGGAASVTSSSMAPPPPPSNASSTGSASEVMYDRTIPNQIEELTMRPGTEYRVWVLYRPRRDTLNTPVVAGQLRTNTFKVFLDSTISRTAGNAVVAGKGKEGGGRRTIHCSAESCTSLIRVSTSLPVAAGAPAQPPSHVQSQGQSSITELDDAGNPIDPTLTAPPSTTPRIDFGEVTVGASKSATIRIENLSQLSAKVEIAAISKVLSTNRNVIVIPPRESVEEKVEFFPRRINERYEKQVFVRNLLNRANDQLVEIRSCNVDVNNVTLHSHLYRILTPNGANFLDFGSVVINSPTVRTVQIENLTLAPLVLSLLASSTEDVEVYVKLAEAEATKNRLQDAQTRGTAKPAAYADEHDVLERITSPGNGNGDLKERFMETLRELEAAGPVPIDKSKGVKGVKGGKAKGKVDAAHHVAGVKANAHSLGQGDAHRNAHGKATNHSHRPQASKTVEADGAKTSVGALVAAALRKGGRGRPVQLYGNAVVFKDRSLLDHHEHLDLAAGPPIAAHRVSPRSKKSALLDSIVLEDKSQLSGQHPKVLKLDFAAGAKANGAVGKGKRKKDKEGGGKKGDHVKDGEDALERSDSKDDASVIGAENGSQQPGEMTESMVLTPKPRAKATVAPRAPLPTLANVISSLAPAVAGVNGAGPRTPPTPDGGKSPALTGKRRESGLLKQEMFSAADVSKMSVDELLVALEQHDARRPTFARTPSAAQPLSAGLPNAGAPVGSSLMSITGSGSTGAATLAESLTLEEEEQFVRRHIALRKELSNLISSGKLVPARQLTIPPKSVRQMIVVLTPNGSIRPHVSTRPKRADSRLFINLLDFDRSYLSSSTVNVDLNDLPVRELIMRSACVRSTLEVQQTSINFGNCEKGEVRSKTIVIQNKSDSIGLFRLRTSGSIASGDLKLGLGRYGVISAFGRKEFTNFSFTPSMFGKYEETIVVENVLDSYQDQTVYVKANVRKQPAFTLDPLNVDFGQVALAPAPSAPSSPGVDGKDKMNHSAQGESRNLQVVDTYDFVPPSPASMVLTNVSKSERTFVITVELEKVPEVPDADGTGTNSVIVPFAEVHLSRDESGMGQALSKAEEEEVEGMMQKLKIARRKGKADKVEKYEARLTELGVELPKVTEGEGGDDKDKDKGKDKVKGKEEKGQEGKEGKSEDKDKASGEVSETQEEGASDKEGKERGKEPQAAAAKPKGDDSLHAADVQSPTAEPSSQPSSADSQATVKPPPTTTSSDPAPVARPIPAPPATLNPCITTLTVTLPASQKTKILIELRQTTDRPRSVVQAASTKTRMMKASIKVHDRKNTDDTVCVGVMASLAGRVEDVRVGDGEEGKVGKGNGAAREGSEDEVSDPSHLALMRHCLDSTYKCEVSPTAFCVGSTLFLPISSQYYTPLSAHFPSYALPAPSDTDTAKNDEKARTGPIGLILGDGYSRQIPGNTHAEANALTNFRARYAQLSSLQSATGAEAASTAATTGTDTLPPIDKVLKNVTCYATMEPCSIRTSGGPSCALELVRAGVRAVYLGVEEPPDFVKCEGVKILEEGGVRVYNLRGLEEECLKAARRGRD